MSGGWGGRRWIVSDMHGRVWRLTASSTRNPSPFTSPANGTAAIAIIDRLVNDAFAPWGSASGSTTTSLLEVYAALTGRELGREYLHGTRGEAGWRHRLETVRAALLTETARGRLVCEPALEVPLVAVDEDDEPVASEQDRELPTPEANTWFELRVVDEVGEAVPGLEVAFSIAQDRVSGQKRRVTTNGAGVARLDSVEASFAQVAVEDVAKLRATLKPRWSKPREARPIDGPNVSARGLDEELSLSLHGETPATLVVVPHFRCSELSGAHYMFGSSFPLPASLDELRAARSELAADDSRKAMLFGHTDLAGAEEVNKALAERRAKAVYALLTHDEDVWEELWSGSKDSRKWTERWGTLEAQHMLNAVDCRDDEHHTLVTDGVDGPRTKQAVKRFQRSASLTEDGVVGPKTRKHLFRSYAALVSKDPTPKERFSPVGNDPFMGCGEYNPLHASAKDDASRRTVLFIFDPAAEPQGLPCKLGDIGPCKGNIAAESNEAPADSTPPYRCKIYREVAKRCPCSPGTEMMLYDLRLYDELYEPCRSVPYRLVLPTGKVTTGTTDGDGWLRQSVPKRRQRIEVFYTPTDEVELVRSVIIVPESKTDDDYIAHLKNLGFGASDEEAVRIVLRFQGAHKDLTLTGDLDDETKKAIDDVLAGDLRPVLEG